MSMKKSIAIAASIIGAASAINDYAIQEITVGDLDALPSDECFYDVTIPALLDLGLIQYAWVPWSKLSNASLALAPHGAFVYKTTNDTVVYEAIKLVPVDSPDAAIVFGAPEPFCTAAKTFDDITSGKVNCSDDEVMNERILTGLNCWASPMSYTTAEPFVNYDEFAWVSADATKCGEYVYQLKDGTGLMQHSCDGPDTNAQSDVETETNMEDNETTAVADEPTPTSAPDKQDQDGTLTPTSNSAIIQTGLATAVVVGASLIM